MAKIVSTASKDKLASKPSDKLKTGSLFTISTEGETLSIDSLEVMKKMLEALSFLDQDADSKALIPSRKRAKHLKTWSTILRAEEEDTVLEGLIKRRTKGGFVVEIDGIEAFLPGGKILNPTKEPIEETRGSFVILRTEPAKNTLVIANSQLPKEEVEVWTSLLNNK